MAVKYYAKQYTVVPKNDIDIAFAMFGEIKLKSTSKEVTEIAEKGMERIRVAKKDSYTFGQCLHETLPNNDEITLDEVSTQNLIFKIMDCLRKEETSVFHAIRATKALLTYLEKARDGYMKGIQL